MLPLKTNGNIKCTVAHKTSAIGLKNIILEQELGKFVKVVQSDKILSVMKG